MDYVSILEVLGRMAIKDIFKISFKTYFNPSAWLDLNAIRAQNIAIWSIVRGLFIPAKPQRIETFEESMKRQNLTEADIKDAYDSYTAYSIVFLIMAAALVIFSFYLLFIYLTFSGWILALAAAGLSLAQAFRYDFWAFQIKNRKLGCTFAEWKRRKIND